MSIKYLQDHQLNQVQRSPNDSPWAKLVAQSELLERSRMRQPQGQAPQGTVAGDIQQQLMATQQQESERQNAELQKAQLLASLINSGHFAAGGLTQPVGTGAYRGILTSNPSTPQATYIPPDSLDSAAQQKKHGMIQSLLDNSAIGMMQGKANIGDALQSYADLFSGKAFSRGFAEGGDIRGYAAGGGLERFLNKYPNHPMSTNVSPYLEAPKGVAFGDIPQLQEALSSAKTNSELAQLLKQGEISNLAGTLFNVAGQREQAANAAKEALSGPRSNLMGTLLNVAEKREQLANQPKPSMTESMSAAAQNPPHIDTLASRMAAADKSNAIKLGDAWTGEGTNATDLFARAKQGLGSLGETVANVARPVGKVLGAVSPIGDVYMAGEAVGGAPNLLAQAIAGSKPSAVPQGELPQLATDLMGTPKIAEMASSYYDKFKNKGNQPDAWAGAASLVSNPSKVETQISQGTAPTTPTAPQEKVIRPTTGEIKKSSTSQNTEVHKAISNTNPEVGNGGNPPSVAPTVPQNIVAAAAAQQAAQATNKSASEEGQGSVLDSLYNKLKDSAVDYSELAKRISENEYDLARERKDGTFNAILGGIGAALSRAGTYEGVGDRVFKPGIGAIAGAGILGGLKLSEAAEDKYAQGRTENTKSLLALQKLKGESLNNVLDAISAQKQMEVAKAGAATTAEHNRATEAYNQNKLALEEKHTLAQIERWATENARDFANINKGIGENPAQKQAIQALQHNVDNALNYYKAVLQNPHAPGDQTVADALNAYRAAKGDLSSYMQNTGIPVGQSAPAPTANTGNKYPGFTNLTGQ